VFAIILALVISGVSSTHRLFSTYYELNNLPDQNTHARLLPGPPSPDEIADEMTPDGKPYTEESAYFIHAALSKYNNSDNRFKENINKAAFACLITSHYGFNHKITTSTSLISSNLGRQFTLVGARPSGTS